MELLPAQRDIRIVQQRLTLSERSLRTHDAAILFCEREQAQAQLQKLPHARLWTQLYRQAHARGKATLLSARLTDSSIPVVIAFAKTTESAFERLALAAKAWKELAAPADGRVLLGTCSMPAAQSAAMLEAALAAALAASAPMPTMKANRPPPPAPRQLTLLGAGAALVDVARTLAMDRGNHLARWLTMLPPNILDSKTYPRALRELARRHGWEYSFLGEAALKRRNAGAFLAVARANEHRAAGIVRLRRAAADGSARRAAASSRASVAKAAGARRSAGPARAGVDRKIRAAARIALVGKGICFDTGGINLKSHKSMYHMHEDMQGSAVAVGTMLALSELRAPYDIECWLAITENQIGARAFRPQEVIETANGITIQVAHSDAEGRMVLADTLALAARERPDLIVDFATLTGACVTALTERYSGVFTNRPEWHPLLQRAGCDSGERVWPFPMDEDYDSDLESSIADVLQCAQDGKGDHILAARFLSRFVAEVPWIHLDMSASNRAGGLAHVPTDYTGFGVRYATSLLLGGSLVGDSAPQDGAPGAPRARAARAQAGAA